MTISRLSSIYLGLPWVKLIPKWVGTIRCLSIRPSVNIFSLSHLLRNYWSDVFRTLSGIFPWWSSCERFSVDKYGRCRSSCIFPIIASPPQPVGIFRQNCAYGFLSSPRCISLKMSVVRRLIWLNDDHF